MPPVFVLGSEWPGLALLNEGHHSLQELLLARNIGYTDWSDRWIKARFHSLAWTIRGRPEPTQYGSCEFEVYGGKGDVEQRWVTLNGVG